MKTTHEGRTIEVEMNVHPSYFTREGAHPVLPPVLLYVENKADPQESVMATLTTDEARQLAKELNHLADDIDHEQSKAVRR